MAEGHLIRGWILKFESIGQETIDNGHYHVIEMPLLFQSSDGDSDVLIPADYVREQDPFLYRQRLADKYMEHFGQAEEGKYYLFDLLPYGYSSTLKTRNVTGRTDRFLYGHPSGKRYRSPNEFWPHLLWLIKQAIHKVAEFDKAQAAAVGKDYEEPEKMEDCQCKLCAS